MQESLSPLIHFQEQKIPRFIFSWSRCGSERNKREEKEFLSKALKNIVIVLESEFGWELKRILSRNQHQKDVFFSSLMTDISPSCLVLTGKSDVHEQQ
jgi:hypothetical protein